MKKLLQIAHFFAAAILICSSAAAQSPALTYSSSSSGLAELESTNDGSIGGSLTITISGGVFSNPAGKLASPADFQITNLPVGLTPELEVSANGTSASLVLKGKSWNHQPENDVSNLKFTFKDPAFVGLTASSVANAVQAESGISLIFLSNPMLSYTGFGFIEVAENNGTVSGSVEVKISGGSFSNPGGTLVSPDNFSINNLPGGLAAAGAVSTDGLTLSVTLIGKAAAHQAINSLNSLTFNFTNSAFAGGIAATKVLKAINYITSIVLDLNDNPAISYLSPASINSPLNIRDATPTGSSLMIPGASIIQTVDMSSDGTTLLLANTGLMATKTEQYSLTTPYDVSTAVLKHSSTSVTATDMEVNDAGTILLVMNATGFSDTGVLSRFDLSEPFNPASAVLSSNGAFNPLETVYQLLPGSEYLTGVGGLMVTSFTISNDGLALFAALNRGGVMTFSLSEPFDISNPQYQGVFYVASGSLGYNISSIAFNSSGEQLYVVDGQNVLQYELLTPFTISTATFNNLDIKTFENAPADIMISPNDANVVIAESSKLIDAAFSGSGFAETSANNGAVDGSIDVSIVNAVFAHAGSTLTHGTDYSVTPIPDGLIPVLSISADGKSGQFKLSGQATLNERANDVDSLYFSFENAAFETLVDVVDFFNATGVNTGLPIRFILDNTNRPQTTITGSKTQGAIEDSFPVTVKFNEPVTGFEPGDVLIDLVDWNGSVVSEIQNFSGNSDGTEYTFDFVTINGNVSYGLRLLPFSVFNASGNGNGLGDTLAIQTGSFANAPPLIENQSFTVVELSPMGTEVGTIEASDPEGDPLTFTITDDSEEYDILDAFSITDQGVITVNNSSLLNTQVRSLFEFSISVSDGFQSSFANGTIILIPSPVAGFEEFAENEVDVYPNPASSTVFVSTAPHLTSLTVDLYDLAGKRLAGLSGKGSGVTNLDITSLHPGVYILSVATDNKRSSYRLLKE